VSYRGSQTFMICGPFQRLSQLAVTCSSIGFCDITAELFSQGLCPGEPLRVLKGGARISIEKPWCSWSCGVARTLIYDLSWFCDQLPLRAANCWEWWEVQDSDSQQRFRELHASPKHSLCGLQQSFNQTSNIFCDGFRSAVKWNVSIDLW